MPRRRKSKWSLRAFLAVIRLPFVTVKLLFVNEPAPKVRARPRKRVHPRPIEGVLVTRTPTPPQTAIAPVRRSFPPSTSSFPAPFASGTEIHVVRPTVVGLIDRERRLAVKRGDVAGALILALVERGVVDSLTAPLPATPASRW
jgi:hypothetical protein